MKKSLHSFLILFFLSLSSVLFAQDELTPITACDTIGNGTAEFNLVFAFEAYTLSGTTPSSHSIAFYETEQELLDRENSIVPYTNYTSISNPQTIHVRLENIDNSADFFYYTVNLIAHPPVVINEPINLFSPNNMFNLTVNEPIVLGASVGYELTFFETNQEAVNFTNPLLNPTSYFSQSPSKTIWVRVVDSSTGCFTITSFIIFNTNGDLPIPSSITQNICDDNSDGLIVFDLETAIPTVLGGLNPSEYTFSFHSTQQNALNNISPILDTSNFIAGGINWVVYCRVQNSATNEIGYTQLLLSVKRKPVIYTIPDLVAYQGDDFTGTASFNLVQEVAMGQFINLPNQESGTIGVKFYLSENDAINDINDLGSSGANLSAYVNIINPQTIYISATNTSDGVQGCEATYSSFQLRVEPGDEEIVFIPDANFKAKILEADVTNSIAQGVNFLNMKVDVNDDGEIQVSEARAVYGLNVSNSSIADLTGFNSFIFLNHFNASTNNITTVDTDGMHHLINLFLNNNPLTAANFVDLNNIIMLDVSYTDLSTIDLSQTFRQFEFFCHHTPNLTSINAKNGINGAIYMGIGEWDGNESNNSTALELICADNFNIDGYLDILGVFQNSESIIVNSYCSFSSEGNNVITGTVTYDFNNDGCDEEDITRFTKIVLNDGTEEGASFTNEEGKYLFYTQSGTFTLNAQLENPSYFSISPTTSTINFPLVDGSEEIVNFCITPVGIHPDLEVVIAPLIPARPGFTATYQLVYRNKGNTILSQDYGLNFFYNQHLMSYVSSTQTPDTQIEGTLNWNYENLMPFESRSIVVEFLINAPTNAENPVNIDDVLTFTAIITPQAGDENVVDNTFILNQVVVGAYDPNDITCIEGSLVSPDYIGEELHYIIQFENTGNFYAENVVVVMDIDENQYDVFSLKVLNSSHNMRAQVRGNKAEFIFSNIYLDSGGHGNILLVMNSKNSLTTGDFVKSKADIYFDYNYPIITNEAETLFQALSVVNPVLDNLISVYPNPVKEVVNISVKDNSTIKTIELYDIQGRLLQTQLVNNISSELNLSSRANGMYFIKINTDLGSKVEKLVKK